MTSEVTSPSPSVGSVTESRLSKRALKRLAKQQKETPIVVDTEREASVCSEISNASTNDEFLDHVQKRIRNLQKRKQKLDKYQEIADAADKTVPSLNADQLAALANKDSVEAPLKELNDVLVMYRQQLVIRATQDKVREAEIEALKNAAAESAKQEGLAIGQEKLSLTVKFLRAASFQRQLVAQTPAEENTAVEKLLQIVYTGDASSLEALDKLYEGAHEMVEENTVNYERVKEIALTAPEKFFATPEDNRQTTVDRLERRVADISFLQDEETDEVFSAVAATASAVVEPDSEPVQVEEGVAAGVTSTENNEPEPTQDKKKSDKHRKKHGRRRVHEEKPTTQSAQPSQA
jgi:hypothetical protein